MVGEIGGDEEEKAAGTSEHDVEAGELVHRRLLGPPGKTMGHAGAIISGSSGTAQAKKEALEAADPGGHDPDRGGRAGRRGRALLALLSVATLSDAALWSRCRRTTRPQVGRFDVKEAQGLAGLGGSRCSRSRPPLSSRWPSRRPRPARRSRRSRRSTPTTHTNVDVLKQQIKNYYGDPLGTGNFAPDSNYAREAEVVADGGARPGDEGSPGGLRSSARSCSTSTTRPSRPRTTRSQRLGLQPGDERDLRQRQRFPAVPGMVTDGRPGRTRGTRSSTSRAVLRSRRRRRSAT